MRNFFDSPLPVNALTSTKLFRLKWATTIAVIGLPIVLQILGALIFFESDYPVLTSWPVIVIFCAAIITVLLLGLYVSLNRVHLRFASLSNGLDEWESGVQVKAQAFAYRVILRAVFAAFMIVSALGFLGVFKQLSWADMNLELSLQTVLLPISAAVIVVFYLIFFLPTLYMAWTLKPLDKDLTTLNSVRT